MKKIILLLGIAMISFAGFAQTNSKGVLTKNVLKLNNGITLSKGDTIMLGAPVNNANEFMFIYEPKHILGLAGGKGADRAYNYRMLIIKFFTTENYKGSVEKKFVASLGYNTGDDVILDCDIAEAIDNAEVIAKGRIPQRFNVAERNLFLRDVLQELKESPNELVTGQKIEPATERVIERVTEKTVQKTETAPVQNVQNTQTVQNVASTSILNKLNTLHKNGYISTNEHYQLLKIITGSSDAEDKKGLIKKLQSLRDNSNISIGEYDQLIDLLL